MTIDAFDWLHRTGANPPDDQRRPGVRRVRRSQQDQSRPYGAPRPHLYEGTFAHEYQHLLEYYESPGEASWVNEGLSDYAQTPGRLRRPEHHRRGPRGRRPHQVLPGFQPPQFGGPENSLTLWEDQGGPEILCDYGAAYTFMEYLESTTTAEAFMRPCTARTWATGSTGLDTVLDGQFGSKKSGMRHHPRLGRRDGAGRQVDTRPQADAVVGSVRLHREVTQGAASTGTTPRRTDSPGAPPNGSDYVRLRDAAGRYLLGAKALKSIDVQGCDVARARGPVEWRPIRTPPERPPPPTRRAATRSRDGSGPAGAVLRLRIQPRPDTIVRSVSVPAGRRTA